MKVLRVKATCGHCGKEWETHGNTNEPFRHAQETGHLVAVQTDLFQVYNGNKENFKTSKFFQERKKAEVEG